VSKVTSSHADIFDGLRLGNCSNVLDLDVVRAEAEAAVRQRASDRIEPSAEDVVIFVSVSGSDSNDGSMGSPVATLKHALALVRVQRSQPSAATINLRAGKEHLEPVTFDHIHFTVMLGKYYLNETIELTSWDSNLLIQNYNDEQVSLSGAMNVKTTWQQYKNGIYQTPLATATPPVSASRLVCFPKRLLDCQFSSLQAINPVYGPAPSLINSKSGVKVF
jgi:hypothetical protein